MIITIIPITIKTNRLVMVSGKRFGSNSNTQGNLAVAEVLSQYQSSLTYM